MILKRKRKIKNKGGCYIDNRLFFCYNYNEPKEREKNMDKKKFYKVEEKDLLNMLKAYERLTALEQGGVDN